MPDDLTPLEFLRTGEWADVAEVSGDSHVVNRIAELGLSIGSRLRVLQQGRPCLLQVGESRLSLHATAPCKSLSNLCELMASLDQMRQGQRAVVESVAGDDAVVQRLLEMGLLEGEEIEVLGFAPMGDPMEIRLRDFRMSLRRREAAGVIVQVLL